MRAPASPVSITTILPERRQRSVIVAQGGCTCCSCCCCLHTLGALGGAIVVTLNPRLHTDTRCEPPQPTALKRFWLSLAVLFWICGGILGLACSLSGVRQLVEGAALFAVVTAVFFPVVQLGALLATGAWILIAPQNRQSQLASLWWLSVWSVGGFAVGTAVLAAGLGLLVLVFG